MSGILVLKQHYGVLIGQAALRELEKHRYMLRKYPKRSTDLDYFCYQPIAYHSECVSSKSLNFSSSQGTSKQWMANYAFAVGPTRISFKFKHQHFNFFAHTTFQRN